MTKPTLRSKDPAGFWHTIHDAYGISFSNHYSEEGSGYGFVSFTVPRNVGHNYRDLGFGHEIELRKGIRNVLFHGVLTQISEKGGPDEGLEVSGVGLGSLMEFDRLNFGLADRRLDRWTNSEFPSGSYVPNKIDIGTSWQDTSGNQVAGLILKPRKGVTYAADDYTYLRYSFQFGEYVAKITFDWETAFPSSWPGQLTVLDSNGTTHFTQTTTGSGSKTIYPTSNSTYIEFRLTITSSGENTAENDTVYVHITDPTVFATTDTLDAARVGRVILEQLAANYGFSANRSFLEQTGFAIDQAVYENDATLSEIMKDISKYGDKNLKPIAWGMRFNDRKQFFVESQDLSSIKYVIPRNMVGEISVDGDFANSGQKVYGVYTDEGGNVNRTATYSDTALIDLFGGTFREEAVQLGRTSSAQAAQAAQLALSERKYPKTSSSISVSGPVLNAYGAEVPIEEIKAGGIVEVREFRAREAGVASGDLRTRFTSFMLVGVEVDLDEGSATLIPASDASRFEKYMARLSQIAGL